MAVDKLVDSTQLNSDLTSVANAIRTKGGTSAQLAFPTGFITAINNLSGASIETGTFIGSGTVTEQIPCDFAPNLIYIYGDLSGNVSLRGVVSIVILKDEFAMLSSDSSSSAASESAGIIHGITGYYQAATYSNGILTIDNGSDTASSRFNSSVTYNYMFIAW